MVCGEMVQELIVKRQGEGSREQGAGRRENGARERAKVKSLPACLRKVVGKTAGLPALREAVGKTAGQRSKVISKK